MLGKNLVVWISAKQPQTAKSTTDSEAIAMAATCILAEYVKVLRESVCLSLSDVRIKCDNRAAIVLATGEGTWNTLWLIEFRGFGSQLSGVK